MARMSSTLHYVASSNLYQSFLPVMRLGLEADRLPPPSTEVKNEWSCTSSIPVCLHGMFGIITYPLIRCWVTVRFVNRNASVVSCDWFYLQGLTTAVVNEEFHSFYRSFFFLEEKSGWGIGTFSRFLYSANTSLHSCDIQQRGSSSFLTNRSDNHGISLLVHNLKSYCPLGRTDLIFTNIIHPFSRNVSLSVSVRYSHLSLSLDSCYDAFNLRVVPYINIMLIWNLNWEFSILAPHIWCACVIAVFVG